MYFPALGSECLYQGSVLVALGFPSDLEPGFYCVSHFYKVDGVFRVSGVDGGGVEVAFQSLDDEKVWLGYVVSHRGGG